MNGRISRLHFKSECRSSITVSDKKFGVVDDFAETFIFVRAYISCIEIGLILFRKGDYEYTPFLYATTVGIETLPFEVPWCVTKRTYL